MFGYNYKYIVWYEFITPILLIYDGLTRFGATLFGSDYCFSNGSWLGYTTGKLVFEFFIKISLHLVVLVDNGLLFVFKTFRSCFVKGKSVIVTVM